VLATLRDEGVTRRDIAKELRVHRADLDALLSGLVVGAVHGEGQDDDTAERPRPQLRVV